MTDTRPSPEAQAFAAAWLKLRWPKVVSERDIARDRAMAADLERLFDIHLELTRQDHHKNWPDCPRCVAAVNEDAEKCCEDERLRTALERISGPCSIPMACREPHRCAACIAREVLVEERK
jgi:hypothetical protein